MLRRKSLLATTGITLTVSTTAFLLVSLFAVSFYILVPVSRQAADDLAALIALSAQTWVELPPQTRPDFERELQAHHNLKLQVADHSQPEQVADIPALYLRFLEKSLTERTGQSMRVMAASVNDGWLHVNIRFSGRTLEVAFKDERLGTRFAAAALLIAVGGSLVILLTSLFLVRRVTQPLMRLSEATARVASGISSDPLDESGPEELANLAKRFNQMEMQVRELLENRTTLLAGISHDLRTPIARMRIALEMLPESADPFLIDQFINDLTEMDHLIQQALELARGLGDQPKVLIELGELLVELVERYKKHGAEIEIDVSAQCELNVVKVALRRVLTNLIDNALRFSNDKPIKIDMAVEKERVVVRVVDEGPGIPEDQLDAVFRPFHRLEHSRSRTTGGSGLGLAITRQLCDANRWMIGLHRRENGGTEARLTMPF